MTKFRVAVPGAALLLIASVAVAGTGSSGGYHKDGHGMGGHGMMSMDATFESLDADGSGLISREEFKARFNRTRDEVFNLLDPDGNGGLDKEEWHSFQEMHAGMGESGEKGSFHGDKEMPDPAAFNAHFPDMDADGDGLVSRDEFGSYFSKAGDTDRVFDAVDLDKNGLLDHDEWHEFKVAHGMKHKE